MRRRLPTRSVPILCVLFLSGLALAAPAGLRGQEQPPTPENPYQVQQETQQQLQARRQREAEERAQRRLLDRVDASVSRGEGIQVHRVPGTSLTAVLHDIDLEEEFLMVRLRFYNDGEEGAHLVIDPVDAYESFFVEVDDEKFFILRDAAGKLDAKRRLDLILRPGAMESWWARFPALPLDARAFHVVIPPVSPFLSVSVDDD
jgi:hypothetical protein